MNEIRKAVEEFKEEHGEPKEIQLSEEYFNKEDVNDSLEYKNGKLSLLGIQLCKWFSTCKRVNFVISNEKAYEYNIERE